MCEFSLAYGETSHYHHLIDPHPLPFAMRQKAFYTASHIHGLTEQCFSPVCSIDFLDWV
jgi:hypothetical protein